jgi:hypothetical protein
MSPPFCWQDKRILARIRQECQDVDTALGVYNALTVVASDTRSNQFATTHAWLASLSGLGERTVRTRVHDLARIKVIAVSTPKMKAPSTYTLLPFGNSCPSSGNGCRTFGKGRGPSVAAIYKNSKNTSTPKPPEATPGAQTILPGETHLEAYHRMSLTP